MLNFKKYILEAAKFTAPELKTARETASKIAGVEPRQTSSEEPPAPKKPVVRKPRPPKDPTKQLSTLGQEYNKPETQPIKTSSKAIEDMHNKLSAMPYSDRKNAAAKLVGTSFSQLALYHGDDKTREAVSSANPERADMWKKQNPHFFDDKVKSFDLKK